MSSQAVELEEPYLKPVAVPPNPGRQAAGRKRLTSAVAEYQNAFVIHYSCETFYDRPEGRSPRITSIAVRNLQSGQTESFSIHLLAELRGVFFSQIEENYDSLEREMLDKYFEFVKKNALGLFLHWNMRDQGYGFVAIEHRYSVLGGTPFHIADNSKIDLSKTLIDIYGPTYVGHPRLEALLKMNGIKALDFLTGKEEAAAFEAKEYHRLHRSTLRKVEVLSSLFELSNSGRLRTNTSWWHMHGGHAVGVFVWVSNNKILSFVLTLVGIVLAIIAL